MTNEERELDLMVADLMSENNQLKTDNAQLQTKLDRALDEAAKFQTALARILAISNVAFRDGAGQGVGEVRTQTA